MKQNILDDNKILVHLLNKANVKDMEFFSKGDFGSKKNKMTFLFEILRDKKINTYSEVQSAIYPSAKDSTVKFKRLFYRFQEKLLNTLFFVDTNSGFFVERAKAFFHCTKRICLMRILQDKGMINLAINIGEKTLRVSQKYEFTELSLEFCKILSKYYSTIMGNGKKYEKYQNIYENNSLIYSKEISLFRLTNVIGYYLNSPAKKVKIDIDSSYFQKILKLIFNYLDETASVDILLSSTLILSFYFERRCDYKNYNYYNTLILKYLKNKDIVSITSIENIVINQIRMALVNNDYDLAERLDKEYSNYFVNGKFNWYVFRLYFNLILYKRKLYSEGFKYFNRSISNNTFDRQPPVIKENMYVLEAYSNLLLKIGKIESKAVIAEFRLNRFLNQVPQYSKDKQGVNIPIILVQILFFLVDKKYTKIIDRMESLSLYSYRYLKQDETFRSQCFIRMISEMVRADFRKQGTVFRATKWLDKLKAMPINTYPESADHEIIPYEDLWEMVLGELK